MKSSSNPIQDEKLILVGRVVGAHGLDGHVKVHSFAGSLSVYETKGGIVVAQANGSVQSVAVEWVRPHGRGLLMALEAVGDRNQAERLIGADLLVKKASLPALEEDTYYWFDLIGLAVHDTTGIRLGRLTAIIPTSANDIYVVKGEQVNGGPQEILIPAVGDVVLQIDLDGKKMVVDPPEGL